MNKKMTPNAVVFIQLTYFFSFSYTLFFMYDIYQLDDTMTAYLVYFASFPVLRVVYIPIATLFVIKNRINLLLALSFGSNILMALSVIFIFPSIESSYLIAFLYALFAVIFTSGFQTGFNYVISSTIDGDKVSGFFFRTGYYRNIMDTLLPIILGLVILFVAKEMAYVMLIVISIATILVLRRYEKIDIGNQPIAFTELFKKNPSNEIPKLIGIQHLIFILLYNSFIQVFEVYSTSYLYELSDNSLGLGIFKAVSILGVWVVLMLKERKGVTDTFWVYSATATTLIFIPLGILERDIMTPIIGVGGLIVIYVFQNVFTGLSFRLVKDESSKNRIIILFQRDMFRAVGKAIMGFTLFLFGINSINSEGFMYMSIFLIPVMLLTVYLYVILNRFIDKRNATELKGDG